MGTITSKTFADLLVDAETETPPHTPVSTKYAGFDPRSPTNEITRTPIQVEQTPDTVMDPRSPTVGIARTPILDEKFVSKASLLDDPVPAPFSLDDSISTSTDDLSSMDSPLPPLDIPHPDTDTVQTPTFGTQSEKESSTENLTSAITTSTEKLCDVKKKKQHRTKQLQESASPHRKQRGNRSPLTPVRVDTNSPRVIVQRKQVAKLGLMSRNSNSNTPVTYERLSKGGDSPVRFDRQDKENVIISH